MAKSGGPDNKGLASNPSFFSLDIFFYRSQYLRNHVSIDLNKLMIRLYTVREDNKRNEEVKGHVGHGFWPSAHSPSTTMNAKRHRVR